MSLDPRLLKSFVVLAEDLHFGRASERLNLTQPALSQQIRRLEEQLQVDLYLRTTRAVELTDAGRAMLAPARAALRAVAQAERAAHEAVSTAARQLRVGIEMELEDMVSTVMQYAEDRPDVALWLSRMHEPHGHEALVGAQIDAFIGFVPPATDSQARRVRAFDIPLSAFVRPDHRLGRREAVRLEEFRESPIAIFAREQSPRLFDRFVDVLSEGQGRQALELRELEATGTGAQVALIAEVSSGQAVGFGTQSTVAACARHLHSLPFDPPLAVPSYISWHSERSTAVDALAEYLSRGSTIEVPREAHDR